MTKKSKIIYEESTLNFRIQNTLKDEILNKSIEKNMTMSQYLRELLESVHNGSYKEAKMELNSKKAFLFSKDFLRLVIWVYHKKTDKNVTESRGQLNQYIKTIKRADSFLPVAIIEEFDKVLSDLLRVINSTGIEYKEFDFSRSYESEKTFNYNKLISFLLTVELDIFIGELE